MDGENQNFMDSKTIIAIVLMAAIWMGWQSYIAKKYPKPIAAATEKAAPMASDAKVESPATTLGAGPEIKQEASVSETIVPYDGPFWSFDLTSRGMALKNILLKTYTDRKNSPIVLGSSRDHLPLQTNVKDDPNPLQFDIKKISENEYVGTAHYKGTDITKKVVVDSTNYSFLTEIDVKTNGHPFPGVANYISEDSLSGQTKTQKGKQILADPTKWQSVFVAHGTTTDREYTTQEKPHRKTYSSVSMAALGSRYFTLAYVDSSSILPEFAADVNEAKENIFGALIHPLLTGADSMKVKFRLYAGPQAVEIMKAADPRLVDVVDFGRFSIIANPLLSALKIIYSIFHNYGVAIILLTLMVRLIVLPLNIKSYKSMKAMQALQPQMNALREKYKDKPEILNKEMMGLMKVNKVNPLGGCLPTLFQLPVFFALYQVLDHSIELYKSPFMLWISDLSLKDPFYILPILMGITMFIQQKITPTTMDPAQAKVLMFMPVIFSIFMVSLPSGLTLYIFISTLFGITQQFLFMKDKGQKIVAA